MDDQPFTTVENNEFCDMVLYLQPNADIPSADTLRRDLDIKFEQVKEQIKQKLQVIIILVIIIVIIIK